MGNFQPALFFSKEIEVGLKRFRAGQCEPNHYQRTAHEVTIIVRGRCLLADRDLREGDILTIPPGVPADFRAITDCILLVIKYPSLPNDKVLGGPNNLDQ